MSDTEKSGAALDEPTATTPAAQSGDQSASTDTRESTTEQASQPEAREQQQSDFAFGTSRGSGLARGKRKTITAPDTPPAQANAGGYQPTAIEVITPKSEYSNPFTGETVVETPRQEKAPEPETPKSEESLIQAIPTSENAVEPEPSSTPVASESTAAAPTETQPKPELKILPPAQPNRSRQSWESPSEHPARRAAAAAANGEKVNNDSAPEAPRSRSPRGSSEGRPTFQPERRSRSPRNEDADTQSPRPENPLRQERPKREPREPRGARDSRTEQRSTRAATTTTAKPAAKPQGFFGWLKSLFGGSSASAPRTKSGKGNEQGHEGGPKRRSRGGRGRSSSNGLRSGSESFSGRRNGEKTAGDRPAPSRNPEEQRDRPRNRSRGGRGGRSRNGPRSEGQQSGGAI